MIKLVINLERRTDRKEHFLEKNKLSEVKFIKAIANWPTISSKKLNPNSESPNSNNSVSE